jgi:hypothetical protein
MTSCGIVSVLIGREFSLEPLLNYFNKVEIPYGVYLNLYLVMGCDSEFELLVRNRISDLKLDRRYLNIHFIPGNLRCQPEWNWSEWETLSRKQRSDDKHKSALYNIEIGLDAAKNETYVHFVDDDTISPNHTLVDLLESYTNIRNCGISSGIYFNKNWNEPTIALSKVEASRRIVASFVKETWSGCSIDDLAIEDYRDMGFVGNGCILLSGDDLKKILPLSEYREDNDDIAPPDFIICKRIRRLGKIISIVPSIIAEHLDETGIPVGLSLEYLDKIRNSTGVINFLVMNYDEHLNYEVLSKQYDEMLVIHHEEIHGKINHELSNVNNIRIIKRSIKKTCEKYRKYKNVDGNSMKYAILEEMHNFIADKSNYVAYYYDSLKNSILKVPLLDSRNLKKLLNQKK